MDQLERAVYRELYRFLAPTGSVPRGPFRSASAVDLPRPLARGLGHLYSLLHHEALNACDEYRADRSARVVACALREEWERVRGPATMDSRDVPTEVERQLRRRITPLAEQLNDTLPKMAQADRRCRRVFGHPGAWDPLDDSWTHLEWSMLEEVADYAAALAGSERILASILPYRAGPAPGPAPAPEPRRTVASVQPPRPRLVASGSAVGALPSELALLAHPETEDLFAHKLAENGVLALRLPASSVHSVPSAGPAERSSPYGSIDQPLYVCVDTSGSMTGRKQMLALALVLVLARRALERGHRMLVLAATDRLRVLDLDGRHAQEPPAGPSSSGSVQTGQRAALEQPLHIEPTVVRSLHRFLSGFGNGGDDVDPALREALKRIRVEPDSRGDILLLSDTRLPRIHPQHRLSLEQLRNSGRLSFHAVSFIGEILEDPLNVLDSRWSIDPESGRVLGDSMAAGSSLFAGD